MEPSNPQGRQHDNNCSLCPNPPDDVMVKCSDCFKEFHQLCVKVPNDVNYKCQQCSTSRPGTSSHSVISQHSSRSKKSQSNRVQLQLQRLEEERAFHREYLNKKYQLLEEAENLSDNSSVNSRSVQNFNNNPSQSSQSVRNWLKDIPEPRNSAEQNQPDSNICRQPVNIGINNTGQQASHLPEERIYYNRPPLNNSTIVPNVSNDMPHNTTASNPIVTNPANNSRTTTSVAPNCATAIATDCGYSQRMQPMTHSVPNQQPCVSFVNNVQPDPFVGNRMIPPDRLNQYNTSISNSGPHTFCAPQPFSSTMNMCPNMPPNTSHYPQHVANTPLELSASQMHARHSVPKELPIFSGQPEEWPVFSSTFHWSTESCGFTEAENLIRLQKSLKGNALQSVQQMLVHPSNVASVMQILQMLFGQPEKIINSIKNRIISSPKVNENNLHTLTSFAVNVRSLLSTIYASNLTDEINNSSLLHELLLKLPSSYQMQWATKKMCLINQNKRPDLVEFDSWVFNIGATASSIVVDHCSTNNNNNSNNENKVKNKTTNNRAYVHSHKEERKCVVCNNNNCKSIESCQTYLSLDRGGKWSVVRKHQLCKCCLHKHNGDCKKKSKCGKEGCEYFHHSSLHKYNETTNYLAKETSNSNLNVNNMHSEIINAHSDQIKEILFKIIPITIYGKEKCLQTFAFIDEGSSISLIEESLVTELELKGTTNPLCLRWTGGIERMEKSSQKLIIDISGGSTKRLSMEVCTVNSLNLPTQSLDYEMLAKRYRHLQNLPINSYVDAVPKILIGLNNFNLGISSRIREGSVKEPVAVRTKLGWLIYGAVAETLNTSKQLNFHICECTEAGEDLDGLVRSFYSLDSVGISVKDPILADNDNRALNLLNNFTKKKQSGHYEVPLLWRFDVFELPDSYDMCLRRLICLERKLKQNSDLHNIFRDTITKYLSKGYIRKLSADEINRADMKVWYLPIFAVFNKNKPGKSRVVWDAAAKTNGVSLNSFLLKGPDLLASLPAILFSFRHKAVAVCGDIEEMFHQVLIRPEDRDVQRFLWRDCNQSKEPDVYVMDVMIFGATCAPSISQFIKNLNATEFENEYPTAAKLIKENHYVDDLLVSVDTPDEAIKLIADVSYVHRQGGFNIRNWVSNSSLVMKSLPDGNAKNNKCLNLNENTQFEKVLGVFWEHQHDVITFKISSWLMETDIFSCTKIPTKREMLRIVMSIYDPLGLIGHIIMYVKVLLQDVWRAKIDWDEKIPEELMVKWTKWISILSDIQDIKIPRCYLQSLCDYNGVQAQLHTFVDASREGYAAVCYLRLQKNDTIICSLIGSKTRVAPMRVTSVPRLELMAALIGARFAAFIIENHKIQINRKFYWSDSKTVLSWINSDHRKYNQFVAFRITEILDLSAIRDWNWIPSKQNVADDATKWVKMPKLSVSNRWFKGPDFLYQPENEWPKAEAPPETTEEERVQHSLVMSKYEPIFDVTRFSNWNRLVRATAFVLRFITNCRQPTRETSEFTQDELLKAENILYRQAQMEKYSLEITSLKSKKLISKSSDIYIKSPYLDGEILRVDGRIDLANIPVEHKHPIILPKDSYITKLIIMHHHKKLYHMNNETVTNEIRQKYSIPQLRRSLKTVIQDCQMCKVRKAIPQNPQMAKLPRARLASYEAPFTFTGVDFFGPIRVTVNRHKEKRYGCLFTCLTVRAVHIEVAHALTTSSCILAIRNFMARRGIPNEFYSDNGTNFVGAERELREAVAAIDNDELVKTFTTTTTKWNFNPPASPHMGGAWERLVRSVKTVLYKIMPSRYPTDELLLSMLIEVENVINSRPLAYVPLDDCDEEAVTPNHFLVGSSNGIKPMTMCNDSGVVLRQNWLASQQYANIFWMKWIAEYLPTLTCRSKWHERPKPLCQGDLVIIVDPSLPRNVWIRGKVVEARLAKDGQVRSASVLTKHGIMERPATKLAILDVAIKRKSACDETSCHTAGGMLPPSTNPS